MRVTVTVDTVHDRGSRQGGFALPSHATVKVYTPMFVHMLMLVQGRCSVKVSRKIVLNVEHVMEFSSSKL